MVELEGYQCKEKILKVLHKSNNKINHLNKSNNHLEDNNRKIQLSHWLIAIPWPI